VCLRTHWGPFDWEGKLVVESDCGWWERAARGAMPPVRAVSRRRRVDVEIEEAAMNKYENEIDT